MTTEQAIEEWKKLDSLGAVKSKQIQKAVDIDVAWIENHHHCRETPALTDAYRLGILMGYAIGGGK